MLAMHVYRKACVLFFGWLAVAFTTFAQQPPEQVPAPWEIVPPQGPKPTYVIHVNDYCALLPDPGSIPKDAIVDLQIYPDLCHLETVLHSKHREEIVAANELRTSKVEVREQEYVLHNSAEVPVIFVVEYFLPKKWEIDSDPQPATYDHGYALFRVHADAGEVVRLHVGMRHVSHKHTKRLKESAERPASS